MRFWARERQSELTLGMEYGTKSLSIVSKMCPKFVRNIKKSARISKYF